MASITPAVSVTRPRSTRAQQVSAACAMLGLSALLLAYLSFQRNCRAEEVRACEQAMAQLYPLESNLSRYLADHVDMHVCLEEDAEGELWSNQTATERVQFRAVCASVADQLEYYLLIRKSIEAHPRGQDIINAWDNNLDGYCRNSYGFRCYIQSNRAVWTPMFLARFDAAVAGCKAPVADALKDTLPVIRTTSAKKT